jgi:hypothetical protein
MSGQEAATSLENDHVDTYLEHTRKRDLDKIPIKPGISI